MDQTANKLNRRGFWARRPPRAFCSTAASVVQGQEKPPAAKIDRKIKVGLVGCGGRGSWIAGLFKQHGGYEFVAAADYFPDRAEKTGTSLGVDKSKCFSGLSAYKRLIDSGVEAVILETPPYFFPEHAEAAVEAGLHVYMAKPVAVDVPGTLKIGALGQDGRGEEAGLPRRLPDADRPVEHRSPQADPRRRPGQACRWSSPSAPAAAAASAIRR